MAIPFNYICKNEIFNEQGLLIIQSNFTADCELLKLNRSFIEEHQLLKLAKINDNWESRNHILDDSCILIKKTFFNIILDKHGSFVENTGWKNSDFSEEKTGIKWCRHEFDK